MNITWTPSSWSIANWPDRVSKPTIQRVAQIDGPDRYAVRLRGNCLNRFGEWEMEPLPSSRDDDFMARCRFDSMEEAINAASVPMRLLLANNSDEQ